MNSSKEIADIIFNRLELENNTLIKISILEFEINKHTENLRKENVNLKYLLTLLWENTHSQFNEENYKWWQSGIELALKG